jgi:hypothetical protein
MWDRKHAIGGVEIKSADRGEAVARIATRGVIDKDNDVILPGAFQDGADLIISSYGHTSWQGSLPVGKGRLRTSATEALVDAQFFLGTTAGREHFEVIKQLGPQGQWSFGFDIADSDVGDFDGRRVRFLKQLTVHEASPVLIGAGIDTGTLAVKSTATLTPQEQLATEFARFVDIGLAHDIADELADIRDRLELDDELRRIARLHFGGRYD